MLYILLTPRKKKQKKNLFLFFPFPLEFRPPNMEKITERKQSQSGTKQAPK